MKAAGIIILCAVVGGTVGLIWAVRVVRSPEVVQSPKVVAPQSQVCTNCNGRRFILHDKFPLTNAVGEVEMVNRDVVCRVCGGTGK